MNRDHSVGVNSPTNFAGETGSVNIGPSDVSSGAQDDPAFFLRVIGFEQGVWQALDERRAAA